ncbi:MAG: hypothetical protein WA708_07650 [Acidobacteriaceae bacterium]
MKLPRSHRFQASTLSVLISVFVLLSLCLFNSGCGSSASPGLSSSAPPFNTAKGEGNLLSSQVAMTYATATTPTQTGLDTFYTNLICPSGLTQQGCTSNKSNLDTTEFGNFDVASDPIANNPVGVQQIDAVKIDYTAINIDGTPVTVSGGVLVPKIDASTLKGVVLYYHGTTVERANVPSNFTTTTNVSGYKDGILWAALWASQGYIVVMPDYIGLGDDTADPHPYVEYPAQNAQTGLAMMLAARTLLSKNYQITANLPLSITGYSEGGAYSLEAAHLMQNNSGYATQLNVQLKKAVPLSGFFDLSGTGIDYLFDNMSSTGSDQWHSYSPVTSILSKPYLSAYLTLSFAHYSGIDATDILAPNFYNDSCSSGNSNCGNLYVSYFTATQFSGYDTTVLGYADYHANNVNYSLDSNAVTPLLTSNYASALQNRDTTNPLYQQVAQADTYQFVPSFPVTLVSLEQDSVVTRVNSDVAYTYFEQKNSKGSYQEDLVPNTNFFIPGYFADGNIDHLSELPFLGVLILNQFNTTN